MKIYLFFIVFFYCRRLLDLCPILQFLTAEHTRIEFENLPGDGLQQVSPLWHLHLARPVMLQSVNWLRMVQKEK